MLTPFTSMLAVTLRSAPRLLQLHQQLAEVSDARDPRGWILSSVAALGDSLPARAIPYMISDAAPRQDTFMGHEAPAPEDRASAIVEGVLTVHAARRALRALDGELPEQPLATTLDRRGAARTAPSDLRHVAFVLDGQVRISELGADPEDDGGRQMLALARALSRVTAETAETADGAHEARRFGVPSSTALRGEASGAAPSLLPLGATAHIPFAVVCLDEEEPAYLRHVHRLGWRDEQGPWLGLGRAGELRSVSTSHFVVDGYGHAWLVAAIAAGVEELSHQHRASLLAALVAAPPSLLGPPPGPAPRLPDLPTPLGISYRALPSPTPRVTPLAYRFGQILAKRLGSNGNASSNGRSPTVFIPIAPGDRRDPMRLRRRVSAAVVSVHSDARGPEPYEAFAARAARTIAAEASGAGILATLHRAAANLPIPLRWKRELIGSNRGRWLGELPAALGGRACLSSIRMREMASPPLIAVSCPVLLPNPDDPIGGCVVTMVDNGERAMIAVSGAGLAGDAAQGASLLEELLEG